MWMEASGLGQKEEEKGRGTHQVVPLLLSHFCFVTTVTCG